MHKIKNKHTGEVIPTPYMAEAQEYLDSGDYEMSDKPVYTKEMHERGELPTTGMMFLVGELEDNSRSSEFSGLECEVVSTAKFHNITVLTFHHITKGIGAIVCSRNLIKPIQTIEDELTNFIFNMDGIDIFRDHCETLVEKLLTNYNITPKDS